ncbi:MAG TPA: DoxX family protein [Polyangia bacterium]|nr:DoxX family protein [Polyangia bacterium]
MRTDETKAIHTRKTGALLWTIQGVLALVFLFAGGMKLAAPAAALAQRSPLPPSFLKLVGLCEIAGALGLVLPGLLRIGRGLTSLAAAGLVLVMVGATAVTVATASVGGAAVPAVVGLLAAVVAYQRRPRARGRGVTLIAVEERV